MKVLELLNLKEDFAQDFELEGLQIPKFSDPNTSKEIGTFDGYTIWGERFNEKNNLDAYGIKDENGTTSAAVIINEREEFFDGIKCQQIRKVWVRPDERGKALIMSIFGFIIRKTDTNLISSDIVTNGGKKLYERIIKSNSFGIKVFDGSRGYIPGNIPVDLFDFPNPYRIIMTKNSAGKLTQDKEMFEDESLSHYRLYRGDSGWD